MILRINTMKKWVVSAKRADFNAIASEFNISPMLARIIRNRDVIGNDAVSMYLNGTINDMHDPHKLKDIDKAAGLICDAIASGKKIFIIGDYDIDGVCSSYILLKGLKSIGGMATVRLPDRIKDGYGMNSDMVDEAYKWGADMILTCDNGIAAYSETEYAKSKGLTVIVTDHHEIPYEDEGTKKRYLIPPADAVVDPKQEDCRYPFKEICGGFVAFKLMQCVFELSGKGKELIPELLMFAGFATVGDVMELKDENRIAVKYALEHMKTTSNHGMNALIDAVKADRQSLTPYSIGFILGPCINATGRLDSADRALQMFMAGSYEEAYKTAHELKALNDSRKDMTELYKKMAIDMIDGSDEYLKDRVLVVYLPDCHESLAGIIAGRIRERYYKPVFVLTGGESSVKGSGRSIENYNMYEEMNKCSDLFIKYGGHKMAAGLSISETDIGEFRRRINEYCTLTEDEMIEKAVIDIPMPIRYADMKFAKELQRLEPFGNGNPRPLFAEKALIPSDIRILGKNHNTLKLKLRSSDIKGGSIDALYFCDADEMCSRLKETESIDVLYEIGINDYMGHESVQLIIKDWKQTQNYV